MWKCSMCGQNNTDTQNACGICGTFKPASASSNSTGGHTMAIRCFVPGCTEGVTGQCAGLENEACGRFYCSKHSRGKLCDECAAVQEERDLIETYIKAAKWVFGPLGCGWIILTLLITLLSGIFSIYCVQNEQYVLGIILFPIGFIFSMILSNLLRKRRLKEKCAELYRFKEFYRVYKKYRNKEQLRSMLVGTMEFTSYMLSPEVSTASDIRRIRKRLE